MTREFFDEFPSLWDAFELRLRDQIIKWLIAKAKATEVQDDKKLCAVYENYGFQYWVCDRKAGGCWKDQLDEVFFDIQYYDTKKSLYSYNNLDDLLAQDMERLDAGNVEEIYCMAVKPLLDARKQELTDKFSEMAQELNKPLPYTLKLLLDEGKTAVPLGFRKRYQKRNWDGMDGYAYSFNGRAYTDVKAFTTPTIERLSSNISIAKDTHGEMVLRRYTEIPTFDSSDREWDSAEIEYLFYDGRDIHLVVMRGGYRIAQLTFYERLLTADASIKPIFEKLGWSTDSIAWI